MGLKGTVGRVSTTGVVPACASLDCLTCFATTVRDAASVVQIMQVILTSLAVKPMMVTVFSTRSTHHYCSSRTDDDTSGVNSVDGVQGIVTALVGRTTIL